MIGASLILATALVTGMLVLARGLVEWEGDRGRLVVGSPGPLAIATLGGLGIMYFLGIGLGGGVVDRAPGGTPAPAPGAPNAPTIISTTVVDTSTVWVQGNAFVGSGADAQDSIHVAITRLGADTTSILTQTKGGAQLRDTISDNANLKADTTYKAWLKYRGSTSALWSAWSAPDTFVNTLGVAPSVADTFSTYTSVANFISDPRGIYDESEHFCDVGCAAGPAQGADGDLVLDTSVGYNASDRSMRGDWNTYGSAGAGGTVSIAPSLAASTTKVWVELIATIESGFQIDNGYTGGVGWKWLFINQTGAGSGRYALEWNGQNGDLDFYPPDAEWGASEIYHLDLPYSFENFNDGLAHNYRMFVDLAADSMCAQIDQGTVYCNGAGDGYNATATELTNVALSRNINQRLQTGEPNSVWWHRWSVWYDGNDPRWW